MKVSLNWLKQYVDIPKDLTPKELALKLTMATVEVEEVIDLGEKLKDVYVGQLSKITKHPDADKLSVAEVDIKSKKLQVVFGDLAEVKEGDLVPIVAAPSTLPTGIKVEKRKIRGVVSEGMLCLDSEFIPDGEDILTYFPPEVKVGSLVKEVMGLDDVIFDIDNKSITHRSDLWGHYGLAREVAAILDKKLRDLDINKKISEVNNVDLKIKIEDKENCTRYIGAVVDGIKIEPSPLWMQNALKSCGVRPINNVVDITNFVTLELGRPSHAFDRREIANDTIIVRQAKNNEKFTTLDNQERKLTSDMCLVCDAKRPVDLAGIMGGENSEVKQDTKEIILELANFNPVNIRKTAVKLGLRTEAAARFEKGLAPNLADLGMKRILTLLTQIIPTASVVSKVIDVNYDAQEKREIELELDFLNRRIGQEIPKKEVIKILENLSFKVEEKKEKLIITPPEFRTVKDISIKEDLVEEVARIYGYENITPQMPFVSMEPQKFNTERLVERKVKNILTNNCGLTEVSNYSFTNEKNLEFLGEDFKDVIELANSCSEEQKYLRTSLLVNLLQNVASNLRFLKNFHLFELGRVFTNQTGEFKAGHNSKESLPRQEKYLAGVSVAKDIFYKIKGLVETLLNQLEVDYKFNIVESSKLAYVNPSRYLEIVVHDQKIGFLTELSEKVLDKFDIKKSVGYWEINFNQLIKYVQDNKKYQPLPKFPGIIYDLSITVDNETRWLDIEQEVLAVSPLIKKVELFDIYQLAKLGPEKKSLAFHIYFADPKKTLVSNEADELREKIVKKLQKKFKAEIR